MHWLKLILSTDQQSVNTLSDLLSDNGAASVTWEDAANQPLLEPAPGETPLWNHTRVIGLFPADTDVPQLVHKLKAGWGQTAFPDWHVDQLEDRDWVRAWLDHFKPMRFGERLWIVPTNHQPPNADAVNLVLDPGLAFGTGTHPTTAMCLEWLDHHPPTGQKVIDYGCGSGILGIAACLLGAVHVHGVDIDPQALTASRNNAMQNAVTDCFSVYLPSELPAEPADVLLANILAGPLHELVGTLAKLIRPGGQLVIAGLLEHQTQTLIQTYTPQFVMQIFASREGWACLQGRKRDT